MQQSHASRQPTTKKRPMRLVGVDYGLARLGLSVSDESKSIAFPWRVLRAEKKIENTTLALLKEVDALEKERECLIDTLVIGLPLSMNGSHSMMTDEVVAWMELLRAATTRQIVSWDERLTSVQADRALRQADMTRKKRAQHVDVTSAVLLLQNYLDAQKVQQERALFTSSHRISGRREAPDGATGDEGIAPAIVEEPDAPDGRLAADRKLREDVNKAQEEE